MTTETTPNVPPVEGAREARYAEAIWGSSWSPQDLGLPEVADVMAVADAEQAGLRAQVDRAKLQRDEEEDRRLAAADELWALREGVRALHFPYTLYEPCPDDVTGCEADVCTENPHDGEWFHSDQPVGKACGECNDEDGGPAEWPCPTVALLAPSPAARTSEDWEPGRDFAHEFVYSTDQTLTPADVKAGQRVAKAIEHAAHCNGRVMTDDGPECDCQPTGYKERRPAPVSSGEAGTGEADGSRG